MRSWTDIAVTCIRWMMSGVAAVAIALLVLLYTAPGLATVAWLITPLSGDTVIVRGLSGDLPNALHVDSLQVRDAKGVWLRAENVSLNWNALAALNNHIEVHHLSAAKIALLRMPESESSGGTTPQIDVEDLAISRIEMAAAVAGQPAQFTVKGALHYFSRHQLSANLNINQIDGSDRYRINGDIADDVANGTVAISESGAGVLGHLIGLPGLGALHMALQASGDRSANDVVFDLSAGALRGSGRGTIALASQAADLDFAVNAPAMQLSPDLSWHSLTVDGHFHGGFDAPGVDAKLRVANAMASGVHLAALSADVSGRDGKAELTGTADGVRIPGDAPDLFANAPFTLDAQADLHAATRPVTFSVSHLLVSASGTVQTAGPLALAAVVTIPSLSPFAALDGTDLGGAAQLDIHAQQNNGITTLALDAKLKAEGQALVARMLGSRATLALRANISGSDIMSSSMSLRGAGITSDLNGSFRGQSLNYAVALGLPDVSRLADTLNGNLSLTGHVNGPLETAHTQISGNGNLASRGFPRQAVTISVQADGLLNPSSARVRVGGRFDNAPVSVIGDLTVGSNGNSHAAKLSADWKSLSARADVALAHNGAMSGKVALSLKHLSDIAGIIGTAMDGAINAAIDFKPTASGSHATLHAEASGVRSGDIKAGSVAVNGTIDDPFAKPSFLLSADIRKFGAQDISGDATARLSGPLEKLAIALKTDLRDESGNPAHATASAMLNTDKQSLVLQQLNGDYQGQVLHLTSPATFDLEKGVAVDHFVATLAGGNVKASGRFTPVLSANLSVSDILAAAFEKFVPQVPMQGSLSATAKLSGTTDAPLGNITVEGRGLGVRGISNKAIAPANVDATAQLHGKALTLHATIAAGSSAHLSVNGEAPLAANGALNLHVDGNADLAMFNPIVSADGRQMRGTVTLDGTVAGTFAHPRVNGSGKLANGEVQDFAHGARIHNVSAQFAAHGDQIDITQAIAHAGDGTISGAGSIDLSQPGLPVNITLEMKDARPIVSDRLTAILSGNAKITGKLSEILNVSANIRVSKGEINLPDKFPPEVAVLDVRRRGQVVPPRSGSASKIVLDVTITSPNQFFVRGHGIDAEMGGRLRLTGTSDAVLASGGFNMERGTLSVAGQTLIFTTGKIGFDGNGIRNRLDPTLNFIAQTTSGGVTATLTVGGYVSNPKIVLSSSPTLPQDEVLAHLLFQQSVKQLTPFQLAEIAQALVSLSGISSGFDALGFARKGLGLDRLSVGGASGDSSQTTLEAGKYVARNVYVGAKQNLSGGTQLQVQYDITRRLKAQATLSTVTNATVTKGNAAVDNGSSVGLAYQFEY